MSEEQSPIKEPVVKVASPEFTRQLILSAVEHASRPIATVLIAVFLLFFGYCTKDRWFSLLDKSETVKVGSFEVKLREVADKANLSPELRTLSELNDEQLQLFLIIGKERNPIKYYGEELSLENLRKLKEVGLLSEFDQKPNNELGWKVSEKGHRLHKIISSSINSSIRNSALAEPK
jgi:hypothetical protein